MPETLTRLHFFIGSLKDFPLITITGTNIVVGAAALVVLMIIIGGTSEKRQVTLKNKSYYSQVLEIHPMPKGHAARPRVEKERCIAFISIRVWGLRVSRVHS